MTVFPPDVRRELKRLATEPCSKLPGMENFVPYLATDWDSVPWFAGKKRKTKRKTKNVKTTKLGEFNPDSVDLALPTAEEIAPIVARLPTERLTMKQAGKMMDGLTLTDAQAELIATLEPLANRLADERACRSRVDLDDARSAAAKYLVQAVIAGPIGDPIECFKKRIRNGLRGLAKAQASNNQIFKRVGEGPRPPLGSPEREAYDAAMDAIIARRNRKLARRDEKEINAVDLEQEYFRQMLAACDNAHDYAIVHMRGER